MDKLAIPVTRVAPTRDHTVESRRNFLKTGVVAIGATAIPDIFVPSSSNGAEIKPKKELENKPADAEFYKSLKYGSQAKELVDAGILEDSQLKINDFNERMSDAITVVERRGKVSPAYIEGAAERYKDRMVWIAKSGLLDNQSLNGKELTRGQVIKLFISNPELDMVNRALAQIEGFAQSENAGRVTEGKAREAASFYIKELAVRWPGYSTEIASK